MMASPRRAVWFHQSPPGNANNPQVTMTETASPRTWAQGASQLPHRAQGSRWERRQRGPQAKVTAEPGGDTQASSGSSVEGVT